MANRRSSAADVPPRPADAEGPANDAASAEAIVTDEGTGGSAADEATGAHKRDLAQSRLIKIFADNWRPCGLLNEDDQKQLTALCCAVVSTVRKYGVQMPLPSLESLSESKIRSSEHPRGALFAALQLMAQLSRSWSNSKAMVAAEVPRCLLAMPAPALCTGMLADITRVLSLLLEDPDVILPVCT